MIILDSNQVLRNLPLDTPTIGVMRAVAKASGHKLGIPSIVFSEVLADYRRGIVRRVDDLDRKLGELTRLAPWWGHSTQLPTAENAALNLEVHLRSLFSILPAPAGCADEGIRREIERLLPASTSPEKSGGCRDVAIWLTILDQPSSPEMPLLLVSEDKAAFGDNALHADLIEEAERRSAVVELCPGIESLLNRLATRRAVDDAAVRDLLDDPSVLNVAVNELLDPDEVVHPQSGYIAGRVTDAVLRHVSGTHAYEVNDQTWMCARTIWECEVSYGLGIHSSMSGRISILTEHVSLFRVRATMLFRLNKSGSAAEPQIIAASLPELISEERRSVSNKDGHLA